MYKVVAGAIYQKLGTIAKHCSKCSESVNHNRTGCHTCQIPASRSKLYKELQGLDIRHAALILAS
jgi:hypothetical protein